MGQRLTPALGTSVISEATGTIVRESVASDLIQSSCCCEEVYPRYAPEKLGSVKSEVAIGQQETEDAVSISAASSDISHIHEIFFYARKLMKSSPRFVLDEAAFMAAIDEPPLFLQRQA